MSTAWILIGAVSLASLTIAEPGGAVPVAPHPVDVTAAGFPFKLGTYVTKGTCNRQNYDNVEFMRTGSHEYEADGGPDFKRIVRIAPGHFVIDEVFTSDEDDTETTVRNDYVATGPGTFRRIEHVAYDASGKPIKRDTITNFRWCPPHSVP